MSFNIPYQFAILGLTLFIAVIVRVLFLRKTKARKLQRLRSNWGLAPQDAFGIEVSRTLFDVCSDEFEPDSWLIDERTRGDLNLDQVFMSMNRCISPIGSQVLYQTLRRPQLISDRLKKRHEIVQHLLENSHSRERIQLCLLKIGNKKASRIAEMLWHDMPEPHAMTRFSLILTFASLVLVVLSCLNIVSWVYLLLIFGVNSIFHFSHKRRIDAFPFIQLGALLNASHSISRLRDKRFVRFSEPLRDAVKATSKIRRRLALLLINDGFGLVDYIKIFFLLDIAAYCSVVSMIHSFRSDLRLIFGILGRTDATLAVASYLHQNPSFCNPKFTNNASRWGFSGIRHPLVASPVPNDFRFDNRAALITGSNMAGKTTFLKTIGVNIVLAQTCNFVLADSYSLPLLQLLTSIGRADNLIEGRSYYLDEVQSILRLVRAAESNVAHFFIVDEVFRGTNPDERIAGAAEVLRYLAKTPHFILAAAHDIELVGLLGLEYDSFHFSGSVDECGMSFDYRIRPGYSTAKTALALLEYVGYPDEIVSRARKHIMDFSKLNSD